MTVETACPGCWQGRCSRQQDGTGNDCNHCGLPGPKPADYEWNGQAITHYINHGNTWQTAPSDTRGPLTSPPDLEDPR